MGTLASDDFNRTDANPAGGNWTTVDAAWKVSTNTLTPVSFGGDAGCRYNALTLPNDQFVQGRITVTGTAGGGAGIGLGARMATGSSTFYRLVMDHGASNNLELSKIVAGGFTSIKQITTGAWTDGSMLRITLCGSVIRIYLNGNQLGSDIFDSAIASGPNGGVAYSTAVSAGFVDDWSEGDLIDTTPSYLSYPLLVQALQARSFFGDPPPVQALVVDPYVIPWIEPTRIRTVRRPRRGQLFQPVPAQVVTAADPFVKPLIRAPRTRVARIRRGAFFAAPATQLVVAAQPRRRQPSPAVRRGHFLPLPLVTQTVQVDPRSPDWIARRRTAQPIRRRSVVAPVQESRTVPDPIRRRRPQPIARRRIPLWTLPLQLALLDSIHRRRLTATNRRAGQFFTVPVPVVVAVAPASIPQVIRSRRDRPTRRHGVLWSFVPDQVTPPVAVWVPDWRGKHRYIQRRRAGEFFNVVPPQAAAPPPATWVPPISVRRRLAAQPRREGQFLSVVSGSSTIPAFLTPHRVRLTMRRRGGFLGVVPSVGCPISTVTGRRRNLPRLRPGRFLPVAYQTPTLPYLGGGILVDRFARVGTLIGSLPDVGTVWSDTGSTDWTTDGAVAIHGTGIGFTTAGMTQASDCVTAWTGIRTSTVGAKTLYCVTKYSDQNNMLLVYVDIDVAGNAVGGIYCFVAGVITHLTTTNPGLPAGTNPVGPFDMVMAVSGTSVTATINGVGLAYTLSGGEAAALATGQRAGFLSVGQPWTVDAINAWLPAPPARVARQRRVPAHRQRRGLSYSFTPDQVVIPGVVLVGNLEGYGRGNTVDHDSTGADHIGGSARGSGAESGQGRMSVAGDGRTVGTDRLGDKGTGTGVAG